MENGATGNNNPDATHSTVTQQGLAAEISKGKGSEPLLCFHTLQRRFFRLASAAPPKRHAKVIPRHTM